MNIINIDKLLKSEKKGKFLAYLRVSTIEQNLERQKEILSNFKIDRYFIDKVSGIKLQRPELDALIDYCRDGDCILVTSIDRLARNVQHLTSLMDVFYKKQVVIHFIKENLTFNGNDAPISNLLLHVIGAVAEFERTLIKERQKEGIEIAKKAGKYKGKPKKHSQEIINKIINEYKTTRISKTKLAKKYNISRTLLYQYLSILSNIDYQTELEDFIKKKPSQCINL